MNWTAIATIAEVVGALAVAASLLYLAVQVRQNTRQSRLSAQQVMVSELGSALQAQAQNRQLASIVSQGLQDLDRLDPVDRVQFLSHISHILRLYEAVYFHRLERTLDERVWKGFEAAIADVISYPGMARVLEMRRHQLSDEFGGFLAELAARKAVRPIFGEISPDSRDGAA